jgi:hypothetical protein
MDELVAGKRKKREREIQPAIPNHGTDCIRGVFFVPFPDRTVVPHQQFSIAFIPCDKKKKALSSLVTCIPTINHLALHTVAAAVTAVDS